MTTHKWSDIKNNMSPERQAKVDDMVRKELVKMNGFLGFHRFGATSWQLYVGPLCIDRHDNKLTVLWGTLFTIFDGTFWKKSFPIVEPDLPKGSYEDSAFAEWYWKPGAGLVKKPSATWVVDDNPNWADVPGVGTVSKKSGEVFIPEVPIPLTENEMEYGRKLAKEYAPFGLNKLAVPCVPDYPSKKESTCCSSTYCASEETNVSAKDIPDPSDKFPQYQKQYWYPGTNIWESWRKHFNLSKEEAEAHWGKKLL